MRTPHLLRFQPLIRRGDSAKPRLMRLITGGAWQGRGRALVAHGVLRCVSPAPVTPGRVALTTPGGLPQILYAA